MEDFVTYEVAKKLKEAGFSQDYGWYGGKFIYSNETTIKRIFEIGAYDIDYYGENLPCPSITKAMKWLREEKKIHVGTGVTPRSSWRYVIMFCDERGFEEPTVTEKNFPTYEFAAIAGIEYVLDNLI